MTRHHLRELDLSVVLGPDECTGIAEWLLNPLQPRWAVEYWSTCKAIGATSEEQLSRLKLHWTEGTELLTLLGLEPLYRQTRVTNQPFIALVIELAISVKRFRRSDKTI